MGQPKRFEGARPRGALSADGAVRSRTDRPISVPLILLFYPDSDPTEKYPGEAADIDGYVVGPGHTVTIAATAKTAGGLDMLDSVWAALRRKGAVRRHMVLLDDRGRTVFVMTLDLGVSDETLRLLRSLLVLPVHARDGFAEVHFFASEEELEAIERKITTGGQPLAIRSTPTVPAAKETAELDPEDWAFLGLLCAVGAFDGPEGPTPRLVAELLGLDPEVFAEQALAVERGLGDLVTDLFAPTEPVPEPARAAS